MAKKSKVFVIFTIFLLLLGIFTSQMSNAQNVNISISLNGKNIEFSDNQAPFIENGTTLIPMRIIFEMLDANVVWDNASRSATSTKNDIEVIVKENSDIITINKKVSLMPTTTKIVNGFMFVPLRAVSEAFAATVAWNEETKAISIMLTENKLIEKKIRPIEFNSSNLYAKALEKIDTVVYIEALDAQDNIYNTGSGVIISEDGIIAICYHTIKDAYSGFVTLMDNRKFEIENILSYDKDLDLALIKISGSNYKYAQIGDSDRAQIGDKIVTISNPDNLARGTISDGIISAIRKEKEENLIQITASLSNRSSGGGLFDINGNLIGIIAFSVNSNSNLNFCSATKLLKKLQDNIKAQKVYELNNSDVKSELSIEDSQKALSQKFSTIKLKDTDIGLSDFKLVKSTQVYEEKEYNYLELSISIENESFKRYCQFLGGYKEIDIPDKLKLVENSIAQIWYELKKDFNNYDISIKIYATGDEEFNGFPPFFIKVYPNDYKFDYVTNKFKYKFEIIHIMDDYYGYIIFHKYNFVGDIY